MRGWPVVLVAAVLILTLPLVLAGCKGQTEKPSTETASSETDEHEGHDHEAEAAKSPGEEGKEEAKKPSAAASAVLKDLTSDDDSLRISGLQRVAKLAAGEERDQVRDQVRELAVGRDMSAEVRQAAIEAWSPWATEDPQPLFLAADSPHAPVRMAVAVALRKVGRPDVLEVIEKLKADPDSTVKAAAAETYAGFMRQADTDQSIGLLIADLGHPDGDRSAQAGMTLEQRGREDRRVIPKLVQALRTSPDPAKRHSCAVVIALASAGTHPGQKRFASTVNATFRSDATPAPVYVEGAPALIEALEKDPSPMVREAAAFGLGVLGVPQGAKPLGRALSDPDPYVRRRAAAALIVVPPDEVKDQLLRAARRDPSPEVRRFAVEAMAGLKGDDAAMTVATCLRDPNPDVRLYACEVLKKIGTRAQTQALLWMFEDPDEDVRWKAVAAVAEFADPAAKSQLIAALNDPSPRVALAAERGVHRLGIGARVLTKEERAGLGPKQ
ncbi:MAG: HEAT repeat domain-containing protein [Armatimonadetes bacterium]|nr:HEAT repeat domain-containing protein [Armatimonadota bacterium]